MSQSHDHFLTLASVCYMCSLLFFVLVTLRRPIANRRDRFGVSVWQSLPGQVGGFCEINLLIWKAHRSWDGERVTSLASLTSRKGFIRPRREFRVWFSQNTLMDSGHEVHALSTFTLFPMVACLRRFEQKLILSNDWEKSFWPSLTRFAGHPLQPASRFWIQLVSF